MRNSKRKRNARVIVVSWGDETYAKNFGYKPLDMLAAYQLINERKIKPNLRGK